MADLIGSGPQPVQLVISLDPSTGAVGVIGPIDNLMLCLGLIELGKMTVINHQQQKDNRITPVTIMPGGGLRQ